MSFVFVVCFGLVAASDSSLPIDIVESARLLDSVVAGGWKGDAAIRLAPRCDDATFLRRAWLDLAGRVPPFAEAEKLAQSGKPLDREAVVAWLVESPEFASYWGRMWAEYLLGQRPFESDEYSGRKLQQFLQESFRANRHYNQIASELISAEGAMDEIGAVNFLLRYNAEPTALAGAVSQKFLGLTLQCAECHDHPHAAWKQTDFWGLSAFFARLRRMTPSAPQPNEQFAAVLERPRGEFLVIDKKGNPDDQGNSPTRTIIPQFPGSARREIAASRRAALAAWLTSVNNPYFASHGVNQIWQRLLGSTLITTLDPASENPRKGTAKPTILVSARLNSNADILEHLRAEFVSSDFDLRRLITVIVLSETYQRSGSYPADAQTEIQPSSMLRVQELFGSARSRALSADQIHLSLGQAFGFYFDDNDRRLAQLTNEEFTYDVPVDSFGAESPSLGRSLALFNGDHARGAVNVAAQSMLRIHGDAAGPAHIRHLFLSLLSRPPEAEELDTFLDLTGEDVPQRGLEDAAWVILNSAEFQTNH